MISSLRPPLVFFLLSALLAHRTDAQGYPVSNTETSQCLECVKSGSLFDFNGGNVCSSTSGNSTCPDLHRCCSTEECCVTDGCRGPSDTFYIETTAASDISQSCSRCRDELQTEYFSTGTQYQTYFFGQVSYTRENSDDTSNLCQYRSDGQGTGIFDAITQTDCVTTYSYPPYLPKCAMCTYSLEDSLKNLYSQVSDGTCNSQVCNQFISQERSGASTTCQEPISTCECFCTLSYPLWEACPQVIEEIDAASASSTVSATNASTNDDGQSGGGGGSGGSTTANSGTTTNSNTGTTSNKSAGDAESSSMVSRTWARTAMAGSLISWVVLSFAL